jgi:hypothetical protein
MAEIYSEYDGSCLTPEQIAELDTAFRADLAEMDAEPEPEMEAGL